MGKDALSPNAVERIIHLNARLAEIANWIEERARLTRSAYLAGGGVEYQDRGDLWEDFELRATVKCLVGRHDPTFNPDDGLANLIAVPDDNFKHTDEEGLNWTSCDYISGLDDDPDSVRPVWAEGLPFVEAFRQTPFCYLFHEIYSHVLNSDLDALLRIGEIEINLILTRQRGLHFKTEMMPIKSKDAYLGSVFDRRFHQRHSGSFTRDELRYVSLLNQKMSEAQVWINEQARLAEREYLDIRAADKCPSAPNVCEGYEMMMEICGCLGENHPEYDEDDDNIVVSYRELINQNNPCAFRPGGGILHHDRYSCCLSPNKFLRERLLGKIEPCSLFGDIFMETDREWFKMLSIGQLWLDVFILQRRVIQL